MTINVRQLNAWYGKNQALHNITLDIQPLSVTALIRPSGAANPPSSGVSIVCMRRFLELMLQVMYWSRA